VVSPNLYERFLRSNLTLLGIGLTVLHPHGQADKRDTVSRDDHHSHTLNNAQGRGVANRKGVGGGFSGPKDNLILMVIGQPYPTMMHRKKLFDIPVPSWDVTHQTIPRRELWHHIHINYSRPGRVSYTDIPAGDGNIEKLFSRCAVYQSDLLEISFGMDAMDNLWKSISAIQHGACISRLYMCINFRIASCYSWSIFYVLFNLGSPLNTNIEPFFKSRFFGRH
jgi:hypothetical protein